MASRTLRDAQRVDAADCAALMPTIVYRNGCSSSFRSSAIGSRAGGADASTERSNSRSASRRTSCRSASVCVTTPPYTHHSPPAPETQHPREAPAAVSVPRRSVPKPGSTVGRIEVPRLGLSAVIRAGIDARTLRLAVGYIPGTALPGEQGNLGLAGHRDTFFRKLRDINPGDEIRVTTKDGVFKYYVQRTTIVQPKDVWVLDPTKDPVLTLVTCYPFTYIGSAPKRFIVRAALQTHASPRL